MGKVLCADEIDLGEGEEREEERGQRGKRRRGESFF